MKIERLCKFTVLRYVPDEIRQEFVNIGLVFHSPEEGYIDIKFTEDFSRVLVFDAEADINFLKVILKGLKSEFSQSLFKGSKGSIKKPDFLEEATSIYTNQLKFSPIYTILSRDNKEDFEKLFKRYVYFE